jgi:hypothetical protein
MGTGGSQPRCNAARPWNWALTSIECWGEEWWSCISTSSYISLTQPTLPFTLTSQALDQRQSNKLKNWGCDNTLPDYSFCTPQVTVGMNRLWCDDLNGETEETLWKTFFTVTLSIMNFTKSPWIKLTAPWWETSVWTSAYHIYHTNCVYFICSVFKCKHLFITGFDVCHTVSFIDFIRIEDWLNINLCIQSTQLRSRSKKQCESKGDLIQ